MKIAVKNLEGKEVRSLELDERLFALPRNDSLVHQVYVILTGNLRAPIAHAKDRGDRAGTGKKPWKQKGTGRARAGSVRSPLWRKGGVTFGPTKDRNFKQSLNQKMRQKAVLIAFSEKLRNGKVAVVENWNFPELKTKLAFSTLEILKTVPKSTVVSLSSSEKTTERVFRNLPKVTLVHTPDLNVLDLMRSEYVVLSEMSLLDLDKRFTSWKK